MEETKSPLPEGLGAWPGLVRRARPLVHCITNYVTVNDVANLLLACGASPVMADAEEEAAEMAALAGALYINLGTLNARTVRSMHLAAGVANRRGIPLVLDPVGVGATGYRTVTARELLEQHRFAVIRGNISEIKALTGGAGSTKGVDARDSDRQDTARGRLLLARELARSSGAVVVISGAQDVIAPTAGPAFLCSNGCATMQDITGSGCMLGALLAAYAGAAVDATVLELAGQERLLHAITAGVAAMGICGERAEAMRRGQQSGNASFRTALIDAMYLLSTGDGMEGRMRISGIGA